MFCSNRVYYYANPLIAVVNKYDDMLEEADVDIERLVGMVKTLRAECSLKDDIIRNQRTLLGAYEAILRKDITIAGLMEENECLNAIAAKADSRRVRKGNKTAGGPTRKSSRLARKRIERVHSITKRRWQQGHLMQE